MSTPPGSSRPPTTTPTPPSRGPGRAVVLGGSLAGLLAAQVLTRHFAEVMIVDRDRLDADVAEPRRGVPQGRHTHGVLVGGMQAMEEILPGLGDGLVARGGLRRDVVARGRWHLGGSTVRRVDSGLLGMLASRPLIEAEVRRRVLATPGVHLLGGYDIVGLLPGEDRARVAGVRVAPRADGDRADGDRDGESAVDGPRGRTGGDVDLPGEVVVDATGRGSRAPTWVAEHGYPAPPQLSVPAGITYVTRRFHVTPGVLEDLDVDVIGSNPPDRRIGVALRQEKDQWIVTLAGMHGLEPPSDLDGFTEFASDLPTPGLARIAGGCEPVDDALTYRFPTSRWRRWDKVPRRMEGLVVIGDAVCSFNPVYGQGMTSAAQQARALATVLEGGRHDLARRGAEALAAVVAVPWALSTGGDRRFPGQPRKRLPERLLDRYLDRLLGVAAGDAQVAMAFMQVLNLLAAPSTLLAPSIAVRVLRGGAGTRAAVPPVPRTPPVP